MLAYNKYSSPPIEHMADLWHRIQRDLFNSTLLVHSRTPDPERCPLKHHKNLQILDPKYTFHKTCKNKTKKNESAKDIIFQVSVTHFKHLVRKYSLHTLNLGGKKSVSAESSACEVNGIFLN